ncbi:cytochrome c [Paracoccus sp. Z330]|uniref:Cytochrome c n=1 Tax=Paracoccus onchidii TaxID=3017813 RepID=A0ABT4ZH02_9RHOB|nr:cytochrome c [Paracoccus onchidii]MDB6178253.1 cytochrome c [Paracoccus onchidii]
MYQPRIIFAGAALLLSAMQLHAETDTEAGRALFNESAEPACALCHALADAGSEGEIGPNLDEFKPTAEQVRAAVTSGIGIMPAFNETLSSEQIETLAQYVSTAASGS